MAGAIGQQRKWRILTGVSLGILMFTIDLSVVNIALPTLMREFQTSFTAVQWVVLSYLLVITSLQLGASRLGDLWGKKYLFIGGLAIFTISSALCGIAGTVWELVGFRALEGLGAVFIAGLAAAIVTESFTPQERGKALGIVSGLMSVGVALGPTLGGVLIAWGSWRAIFWINIPIGLIAMAIILKYLPLQARPRQAETFDYLGAGVIALSLGCFALGMTTGQARGFTNILALSSLTLAAAGIGLFLWIQTRVKYPTLNLQLFRNWELSRSVLLNCIVNLVIAGGVFVLPFFFEIVKQFPTQQVGMLLAVCPISNAIISPMAGQLSDRWGTKRIRIIGLGLVIGVCFLISQFNSNSPISQFILTFIPYGIGLGLFQAASATAIMSSVPPTATGIGSGLIALVGTLGQLIGVPLMGSLFILWGGLPPGSAIKSAPPLALTHGLAGCFLVAAGLTIFGLGILLIQSRQPPKVEKLQQPSPF
ncbi:MFS transporter [Thermosynechococcaceae cyanobacterium BACA0444]|uniref:MFS transporter n=1 Tax=Pseudocalidococcus azoricus BACA0444 TaxID=2918990 RepID=A0AAE4FUQ0_9CYAN|nr:MFS transporter [Pseudocalidococcus azoricus]MDS3861602.1 MFS transporter [Pseudocalidococcus azoricus BACA0444]